MIVTSIYAALLSLLYVLLSVRVIGVRRSLRIGLADGGHRLLIRRIRVHANFVEYVPLALILMLLAETQRGPKSLVHVIGLLLLCGRLVHAYGVGQEPEVRYCRSIGMVLTFGTGPAAIHQRVTHSGGSQAKLIVTDEANRPKLDEVPSCPPVIVVDRGQQGASGFAKLLASQNPTFDPSYFPATIRSLLSSILERPAIRSAYAIPFAYFWPSCLAQAMASC
jgi:uncharacterized protein